ncbi:MAG TPA: hypothetical protein VKY29_05145, partial [Cryomorphaceae bacterium]|nr:hypothetical protein [Cryomorphaceae bacterium]
HAEGMQRAEQEKAALRRQSISELRRDRDSIPTAVEKYPELVDEYTGKSDLSRSPQREDYDAFLAGLSESERAQLDDTRHFYQITFGNQGMVMPVVVGFYFEDGTEEVIRIPAEIWKMNDKEVTKVFAFDKRVDRVLLDPYEETTDIQTGNNTVVVPSTPSRIELYKP